MNIAVCAEQSAASSLQAHQGCGNYVEGYVPVAIDRAVQSDLRGFRRKTLNVDLRIERAMVSAATDLCLSDAQMRGRLKDSATEILVSTPPAVLEEMTQRSQTAPVLIRREVKKHVRDAAAAWGLDGADDKINNVMVSAAISIVLACESLHERWVALIASTVSDEVREGFHPGRGRAG